MRVEQLGQLFERDRSGKLELYWVDPSDERWQIYGHGIGDEELIPQKVFWLPSEAKPAHHADAHLKKVLKKIRFSEWIKTSQVKAGQYFEDRRSLIAIDGNGGAWQKNRSGFGLQGLFWLPETAVPVNF